jgi:hypothetical protein
MTELEAAIEADCEELAENESDMDGAIEPELEEEDDWVATPLDIADRDEVSDSVILVKWL